jgi:hypothetical protein
MEENKARSLVQQPMGNFPLNLAFFNISSLLIIEGHYGIQVGVVLSPLGKLRYLRVLNTLHGPGCSGVLSCK